MKKQIPFIKALVVVRFDFDRRSFCQSKDYFASRKKVPFSITTGNGTSARVFSQTLAHGNSKNEIRLKKQTKVRRGESIEKKQSWHEKNVVPTAYHILIKLQ